MFLCVYKKCFKTQSFKDTLCFTKSIDEIILTTQNIFSRKKQSVSKNIEPKNILARIYFSHNLNNMPQNITATGYARKWHML